MPRCACIDIGSNTTRLLVAEDDGARLRVICTERAFTRLGAGGDRPCTLGTGKVAEVAAVVARQVALARAHRVDALRVLGTAAARRAQDAAALAAAVESAAGVPLEILSGEEEARLAFRGAIGMLAEPPPGLLGVVDVGGGSSELVAGTAAGGVTWSISLPIGSSVLTAAELPSDPPGPRELARARAVVSERFAAVDAPRPAVAYAVGGSATSLARLMGRALDREALARGLRALVARPAAEVAPSLGLHAERARLLPAAILLLDACAQTLQAPLRLTEGGLREGVALELLAALGG